MRYVYVFIFSLLTILVYSQNITLEELTKLNEKSLEEIKAFFIKKGWEEPVYIGDIYSWATYSTSFSTDKGVICKGRIAVKDYLDEEVRSINIRFDSPKLYSNLVSRLKPNGFKLVKKYPEFSSTGKHVSTGILYSNGKKVCLIFIRNKTNDPSAEYTYNFLFMDKRIFEIEKSY